MPKAKQWVKVEKKREKGRKTAKNKEKPRKLNISSVRLFGGEREIRNL
jgi:hypothetical protein